MSLPKRSYDVYLQEGPHSMAVTLYKRGLKTLTLARKYIKEEAERKKVNTWHIVLITRDSHGWATSRTEVERCIGGIVTKSLGKKKEEKP